MKLTLRAARINAGLTLQEASKRSGFCISSLAGWENGSVDVSARKLFKLCSIYGVSIDDIFLD